MPLTAAFRAPKLQGACHLGLNQSGNGILQGTALAQQEVADIRTKRCGSFGARLCVYAYARVIMHASRSPV